MLADKIGDLEHFPYVFTDFATEEALYFITGGQVESLGGGYSFSDGEALSGYMETRVEKWGGIYLIATKNDLSTYGERVLSAGRYADENGYSFRKKDELINRDGKALYSIYSIIDEQSTPRYPGKIQ